ncbi:isopenicillin N synthase family dioxygenase [Rhodoferax sp.]|uniref:isopenicillin N synthase family dioxygenase n=1 Tax=Rhodoferax sp. TaxID=50421 RepID=UPI00374CFB76
MVMYTEPTRALRPTLDIAPWLDGSDKPGVARQLDRICREIGFFYLVGHGMAEADMQAVLAQAQRFFAQTDAAKQQLAVNTARRGYEAIASQALDLDAPPDLKESYLLGPELAADHPHVQAGLPNYGANLWPGEAVLPGFQAVCEGYLQQVLTISEALMGIFALAAGEPEDYFDDALVNPMATLRMLHYPPQPHIVNNQIGCGAHTDWGAFTILLQDDTGGLEVQSADGEWLYADPVPGAFVVNLGDMMPVWTNGAYHSNGHRVRNRSPERHRYSIPFFQDMNYYTRIWCLPAFRGAGDAVDLPTRTAGEHFELMYRLTHEAAQVQA